MSDEERNRILMEHERNLVQVENSLTLSKLRQKRMLEEALAERREKQMARLRQKQEAEATVSFALVALVFWREKCIRGVCVCFQKKLRGDVDDEEVEGDNKEVMEMIRRHEEQKLELLCGDETDVDEEMATVRSCSVFNLALFGF